MNGNHTYLQSAGTAGGTLTVLLANISSGDILKTAVQAVLGAVLSFAVSWLLNKWLNKRRK
jgi:mannitol-specific phosphotransferase system IIBC component